MTRLGKYELHEVIGKGGFGTVYRATDMALDREIALKVLHPALLVDTGFIQRFRQEARLAAKLDHPHIVPVYDLDENNGQVYLAMRYLPGGSLKDMLSREGAMKFEQALSVLRQLASALDYAHSNGQGLIHRDIKPGNILWEDENNVRLSDFGFAKAMTADASSSYSISGGMVGTPAYMAPEIWRRKTVSPATDVYSLGCVFYEMLTGQCLFTGDSPADIMTSHVLDGPSFPDTWPEGIPPGMTEVLARVLANTPEERYSSCGAFADAVEVMNRVAHEQRIEPRVSTRLSRLQSEEQAPVEVELKQETREAETSTSHEVEERSSPEPKECERVAVEEKAQRIVDERASQPPNIVPPDTLRRRIPWWAWLGGALVGLVVLFLAVRGLMPESRLAVTEATVISPNLTITLTELPVFAPTIDTASTEAAVVPPTLTVVPELEPVADPNGPPACTGKGQTWVSPVDGMTLVCVPASEFEMGIKIETIDQLLATHPNWYRSWFGDAHTVYLDAYWMDQTEVTNAQYAQCVEARGCTAPVHISSNTRDSYSYYGKSSYDDYPVIYVDRNQASAYCAWAERSLPTEAQWEKAARGTDGRIYPWGNGVPTCQLTNFSGCVGDTTAVGSYPNGTSPYGALDMAGNVWEWVMDSYGPYPSEEQSSPSPTPTPFHMDESTYLVLRGGSWNYIEVFVRATVRDYYGSVNSYYDVGFRCALTQP